MKEQIEQVDVEQTVDASPQTVTEMISTLMDTANYFDQRNAELHFKLLSIASFLIDKMEVLNETE